jgi:hypothetical protein
MGSGVISFNGCFHDLPWGLQTHIYAPANVDLRNKYRIGGNQPGVEPPEQAEIGLKVPKDGLYLREDIEIRCNFAMMSFVKAQLKVASKEMVDRIIKKAELLDAGVLTAMIEGGKLKTQNPNDRSYTGGLSGTPPPGSPSSLHRQSYQQPHPGHQSFQSQQGHMSQPPMSPGTPYQIPRPMSYQVPPSSLQHQQYNSRPGSSGVYNPNYPPQHASELSSQMDQKPQAVVMELPGDYYHPQSSPHLQPPQPSPQFARPNYPSGGSEHSAQSSPKPNDWRWSQGQPSPSLTNSRPTSYSSEHGSGAPSPGLDHKNYSSDLSTHRETREEHQSDTLHKLESAARPPNGYATYNPQDYARMGR